MGKNELSKEQGEMELMEFPEIPAEESEDLSVNRVWKSRIFEMLFSNKAELLKLYNAVNGTDYGNPDDLEINTLKNAIYMSMHNDISFILSSMLNLYEHQSTYNPNLPLRLLLFTALRSANSNTLRDAQKLYLRHNFARAVLGISGHSARKHLAELLPREQ